MNNSFDEQMRQKTSGHEAPVAPGTWEAIAQKKKKKRRYPFFWWITGVTLLSAGLVLAFYKKEYTHKDTVIAIKTEDNRQPAATATGKVIGKDINVEKDNNPLKDVQKTQAKSVKEQEKKPASMVHEPVTPGMRSNSVPLAGGKPVAMTTEKSPGNITRDSKNQDNQFREDRSAVSVSGSNRLRAKTGKDLRNNQRFFSTKTLAKQTATDNLPATNSFLPFNYGEHKRIAVSGTQKSLIVLSDSLNIDNLLIPGFDSLKNEAAIAAINRPFNRNKWSIEISVMPFLPVQHSQPVLYVARTNTESMRKSEYKTDKVNTHFQPSVAYTIAVHKKINSRWRIGTGLQYAMIKEKVDLTGKETRTSYTEVQRLVNGSSGPQLVADTVETTSSGTLSIDALNSYRFISIPVFLQYRLVQRQGWSLQINGGILVNIAADYHNSIQGKFTWFDNQGIHTAGQRNDIAFDVFAGLRFAKAYRSFSVFAEPLFRYNVRRYDFSNMVNSKFMHQAGLSLGATYTLSH